MAHFLLVYDRLRGALRSIQSFDDGAVAMRERFNLERDPDIAGDPSVEIVVLTANSEEDLHVTHARYFNGAEALMRAALASNQG